MSTPSATYDPLSASPTPPDTAGATATADSSATPPSAAPSAANAYGGGPIIPPRSSSASPAPIPPTTGPTQDEPSVTQAPVNPLLRLYEQTFDVDLRVLSSRWAGQDLLVRFSGSSTLPKLFPAEPFTNERPHRVFCEVDAVPPSTDFERLASNLLKTYPTNLVPALPTLPSTPARALDRGFLIAMERFLYRILRHPVFAADHAVIMFCTSPAVFDPPAITSATDPASSLRVPSPSWSDKLKAMVTSGPKDVDATFEQRKEKCAELDFCLKALTRSAEKLAASHRALATAMADVSVKAAALGAAEQNATLAGNWHKFGRRMQIASDAANDRSLTEASVLAERVQLALKACGNTQVALDRRLTILDAYDDACKATERHKRKMDKLRAGRPSEAKVAEALAKLDVIKANENVLRTQFRTASDLLSRDWPVADEARLADLHEMVVAWAKAEHDAERRMMAEVWVPLRQSLIQGGPDNV
ncbi:Vps5 C terminal like-domain-containing protein [Catenaria anguillulae PL171]|uniref:Vps5 C terminal like-domain-containing protein n=1 Tax=Catenaria anguillulae PL171 TaxID=765915 RepID=A0A1Y2HPQ4_9FUNG|nr:Vps5 C terminal like-domain-containing protein [Catenaria anguillulae PL171]